MERDMSQAFCRCGCGFYGNQATDGMCSKCYKDAIQKKNRDGMVAPQTSTTQSTNISNQISNAISNSLNESDASTMVALAAALNLPEKNLEQKIEKETFKEEVDKSKLVNLDDNVTKPAEKNVIEETKATETTAEQAKTQKKKKPRCAFCNVKLPGCVDYPCRCGGIFCVKHRYDKEHNCTFDYREHGAQEIRKNNPQIVGEKIQKI